MNEQNINITKKEIQDMSYPDFVGFINQTNVLPGAYDTLNRWIKYGNINSDSFILDVACTTGFKLREISYITNCSGEAFDISNNAIASAIQNQKIYLKYNKIKYFICDGYKFRCSALYSHVILGAGLGFFSEPKIMLSNCINWLKDDGLILASPYYVKSKIPDNLVKEAEEILGISVTNQKYKKVMDIYLNSGLEVIYESRKDIIEESEKEMKDYVHDTIARFLNESQLSFDKETVDYLKYRLYQIKKICNKLRKYQMYSVIILRKRLINYPKRFVELF